jgi:hypothetical protein
MTIARLTVVCYRANVSSDSEALPLFTGDRVWSSDIDCLHFIIAW